MEGILGIDLGTTGVKTTIFGLNGKELAVSPYVEYPTEYLKPLWVEHDPDEYWRTVVSSIKMCLKLARGKLNPRDIIAIGSCGLMCSITPIGKNGEFLRRTMIHLDQRSTDQCREIEDKVGSSDVLKISGNRISSVYVAPKIMWIKENEPDVWERTYKFIGSKDLINFKLTGSISTDWSEASLWTIFDNKRECWSEELCEQLDIPMDKLPDCFPSAKIIGEVTSQSASETGLTKGTPVACGAGDFPCTAFGAGLIAKGRACENTGTVTNLATVSDLTNFDARLLNSHSVQPKLWLPTATLTTSGATVRWFKDNFAEKEVREAERLGISPYEVLDKKAAEVDTGAKGLIILPYFQGERSPIFDVNARGVIFGLYLGSKKEHIFRAILESIAYGLLHNLEVFKELGYKIEEIRAIGGGARSKLWLQIKADVLDLPFMTLDVQWTGALGAALLGAIGVKVVKGFDAIDDILKLKSKYAPNKKNHKDYMKFYKIYRNLYEHLREDYMLLSEAMGGHS